MIREGSRFYTIPPKPFLNRNAMSANCSLFTTISNSDKNKNPTRVSNLQILLKKLDTGEQRNGETHPFPTVKVLVRLRPRLLHIDRVSRLNPRGILPRSEGLPGLFGGHLTRLIVDTRDGPGTLLKSTTSTSVHHYTSVSFKSVPPPGTGVVNTNKGKKIRGDGDYRSR